MSERILDFSNTIVDRRGRAYGAHVTAAQRPDGLWEGRVVFSPVESGEPLTTRRETVQSDVSDLQYWAAGLTPAYLEGALERAQDERRGTDRTDARAAAAGGERAAFEIRCSDDRVPAELLGTFALEPGVSRDLPDGSRLTYAGTRYRGEDGSERAHTFELQCAEQRTTAEQWLREHGVEPRFEESR